MFHKNRLTLIAALAACTLTRAAFAEAPAVLPYMADDIVAVACVDLDSLDVPIVANRIAVLESFLDVQVTKLETVSKTAQSRINRLRELGLRRIYVLFRVNDVAHGGPTWFARVKDGGNPEQLVAALKEFLPRKPRKPDAWLPKHFAVVDGAILAASTEAQLEAFQKSRRDADACRADAKDAVSWCASHTAGFVLCADADSRRVLREMFPRLPEPFEKIDGPFVADSLRWAGVAVDATPGLRLGVRLELKDETSAKIAGSALTKAVELGRAFLLARMSDVPEAVRANRTVLAETLVLLEPKTNKTTVSLTLGDDPDENAVLAKLFEKGMHETQIATTRGARMNRFKQLGLAFHNYYDRNEALPPAAICDKNGKPLLSWRVALLPYLENNSLYKEFHLDEPWDSEHNRKLIKRMPDIFADPDPAVRKAVGDPHETTYVVPTGEGTLFHGGKGRLFKEITDGMSSTVLAVEVVPERAVIWTKPDEWEVDWKNPLNGVRRNDGRPFTSVFCDGAVHILRNDIDAEVWKKLLTSAGGEVVDWSEWKK